MKVKKGDWVEFTSPLFNGGLFDLQVSIGGKMVRPDHSDHLREGIVVEASHPDVVQVLYTGRSSPKWVLVSNLKRIEVENEKV